MPATSLETGSIRNVRPFLFRLMRSTGGPFGGEHCGGCGAEQSAASLRTDERGAMFVIALRHPLFHAQSVVVVDENVTEMRSSARCETEL